MVTMCGRRGRKEMDVVVEGGRATAARVIVLVLVLATRGGLCPHARGKVTFQEWEWYATQKGNQQ